MKKKGVEGWWWGAVVVRWTVGESKTQTKRKETWGQKLVLCCSVPNCTNQIGK